MIKKVYFIKAPKIDFCIELGKLNIGVKTIILFCVKIKTKVGQFHSWGPKM